MTIDFLIIGQGLAGTLLAHFLEQAGQKVHVVDHYDKRAATRVAAGIINPITGRRYVKSWRVDDLIPFARKTYLELENELGIFIFHRRNILRALFNSREENDWLARAGEEGYADYMLDKPGLEAYAEMTVPAYSYGEVQHSAQVDVGVLADAYRSRLRERHAITEELFDYARLEVFSDSVRYGDIRAGAAVFCEGYRARHNPFFNYLPFGGAKGEVLLVRIPDVRFGKILKHRIFIVPLENGRYWVGSTYGWDYEDDSPTEQGRAYLEARLRDVLKAPFEVVDHRAAIRPTVKDRRPFLGRHPEFPSLALFNGLGTKGASLGPFWAKQMADFLTKNVTLEEDVDIGRFEKT
ncbi:MAG: FAD-binding oxidoreductase [Phaeodactylibacter sp.]|nr:FAD-binding oxidoreductase [Phaeodactylibacter sp.]MCB9263738.1 FAD-binding oxidoreductase [Lewinellaceae bacterium]MCB9286854.1 FAD-binding oxidoreductase [Lewinellaceae bacterium]